MFTFVIRRILHMIPTIFAMALLVFCLFSVIPGDYASTMNNDGRTAADPAVVARLNKELGLDQPVHVRFSNYLLKLGQFDLGTSFRTGEPVTQILASRMGPTLKLVVAAMLFAAAVGVPLGFLSALRPGGFVDTISMMIASSGLSLPQFWFGLLLMYFFALLLGWLPSFGYGNGGFSNLILPAVTLGVSPLALLARTTRAAVLDVKNSDFVRTARAKGMSEYRVVTWHIARNALILVITTIGLQFGSLMGQAVVVENLFSWPGIGSLLVDSVSLRDIPTVQGAILLVVLFFLLINTLVDILYAVIDPRIKYR